VSATLPALLVASGGVGLAHSLLPDHWLPLAVSARARRDPLRRVARMSLFAGLAHVLVSVALGAIVIVVGLSLRSAIESRTNLIVGAILITTGLAFLIAEATGHGHHHHDDHDHDDHDDLEQSAQESQSAPRGLALLIPFGAAASPDLTILPVFLAAAALGTSAALGSLLVFTVITIATFVALTTLAAAGAYQLRHPWLDEHANTITAAVLIIIGALVATSVL
jgi:nickel/cobalt exporter